MRRTELRRHTPLKRAPFKPKRSNTGPDRDTVDAVYQRAGWACERDGVPVGPRRGVDHHLHHRRPRAAGGSSRADTNTPANLLLLCPDCHREVESGRTLAVAAGFLVLQSWNPALVPVWLCGSRWVFLTEHGTYTEVHHA